MRLFRLLLIVVSGALLSSCYYNNKLVYLQNTGFKGNSPVKILNKSSPYLLQINDVLSVKIKSPTDPEVSNTFNVSPENLSPFVSPGTLYMEGYSINNTGNITLPILGTVHVKDLSVEAARDSIQRRANKYLNEATVSVKLVSFKITVLGEVKNPGYHYVFNNQVTVLEALGVAGDLTNFGNRKNVKLIRPTSDGNQVTLLDLTDSNLLKSPYYYVMPNDVIYVEPLKARSSRSNLEVWSVVFAAATTTILILNYIDTDN